MSGIVTEFFDQSTLGKSELHGRDNAAFVMNPHPSVFDISWTGAGIGGAPATSNYWAGAIGVDNDGATGALVYHVVEIAGTLTWVATGTTINNLYGG